MSPHAWIRNERGIALIITIMVSLVVGALSVGALMLSTNTRVIGNYNERASNLAVIAEAGLEVARSALNANGSLYPSSGYATLEDNVTVTDASGSIIPNVRRTTYAGPTGITSGQYGVNGSIVSVAEDNFGNRVVRRGAVSQESFAKYAYFTTIEGTIWFASGDQIWGPVHSNDRIRIYSTGAWFHDEVVTGEDVYQPQYGTFDRGYTEDGPIIPMPTTADLTTLQTQATPGNTAFTGNTTGGQGQATTRLFFIALDLNGDGDSTDANEGFVRVYQHLTDPAWVTGDRVSDPGDDSENCGDYHGPTFVSARDHPFGGHNGSTALTLTSRRCYLGGDDSLWGAFNAGPDARGGRWLPWPGAVSSLLAGRADRDYLFPLSRELNPNFKGVIYVSGKVGVSGVLRGKVTVAATNDIVILDDMRYASDPGLGTCNDMLGLFSGDDVIISDNSINAPWDPGPGGYRTYDETTGEFIHGVVLALDIFTAENYSSGSASAEYCETRQAGRGCIYLTGGIVQRQRGAVGLTSGRGYVKRYSYDQCVLAEPPPYFPTTGHFNRGRLYEIDPTGFDVDQFYQLLTP